MSVKLEDEDRKLIEFEDANSVGDSAEFIVQNDGSLMIRLDEPWAGDTETGFGRTCSLSLSKDDALALMDFLDRILPD